MSSFNKTVKDFTKAIKNSYGPKTSGYDTKAEVVRVSGNTAWVHIPGGIDETPVELTVDAKKGDTVQVRVSDGSAWMTGNLTAPPTDDTAVKKFESKVNNQFVRIVKKADKASTDASFALKSANGKNTVYYSDTRPTGGTYVKGDTWFDTDNDYKMSEWNGTTWMPFQLGEDAIADLSITNAKIADATIEAAKISTVDVGSLTGGYINAGHIDTGSLTIGAGTLGDKIDEMDQKDADLESDLEDLGEDIDGLGDDISDLNEDLDTLENRVEAIYGTCDTSASTAIKEVICDGFVQFTGAKLSVKFTYGQNTSTDTPKLKILNNDREILLDAKDIRFNGSYVQVGGLNRILWTSNTLITFMYDGSTWNVIDKPGTYYVISSSGASSAVKNIAYNNILMVRGTKIFVKIVYKNTATGYLKLSFGFGDMYVRVNNNIISANELLNSTTTNEHLPFIYDGQFGWEYQDVYASKTATKYITYIDPDNGIHVHDGANTSDYVNINSNGMSVYKDDDPVAFFGDFIALGGNNAGYVNTLITPDSMSITADSDPSFSVQTTGEKVSTIVRMLYNSAKRDIYSSTAPSTKTKSWTLRLPPNSYTIYLGSATATLNVTENGYSPTTQITLTGTSNYSANTLTAVVRSVSYINGILEYVKVDITHTANRSTSNTKRITWLSSGVYYNKEVYESSILWNGKNYYGVGNNIIINGGSDYTDIGEMDQRSDFSVSANTVKTIGSVTLSEGVYVLMIRARFRPTTSTEGTKVRTTIQFSTLQEDTTVSDSKYSELPSSTSSDRWKWNQHLMIFMASPEDEVTYYVSGYSNVAGKWLMTGSAAFQIRAIKIR